jgi:hypothetical protein
MNLFWTYPIWGSAGMFRSGYQTNMGKVPMEPTWSWFGAFYYKELSWSFEELKNYAQTLQEVPHSPNNFGGSCFCVLKCLVFWSAPTEEDKPIGWGSPPVPHKRGTSRRHRPASCYSFGPTIPWLPEQYHTRNFGQDFASLEVASNCKSKLAGTRASPMVLSKIGWRKVKICGFGSA